MLKVYGVNSDQHAHNWNAFSSEDEHGRNNRLMGIIAELKACCDRTLAAGSKVVVLCGDLFHTRGSVDPDVFNPIREFFEAKTAEGFEFYVIAGNHDLQSADSNALHSAVAMLASIEGFHVFHETVIMERLGFVMVPWHKKSKEYVAEIERVTAILGDKVKEYTMFCHIGIDGTLTGMPAHNVSPEWAAGLGYKRFFSGHYHNHRDFGGGVYSVGALTHQTWGDVRTRAGFIVVNGDDVQFFGSKQPQFVDITSDMEEHEAALLPDGNYVRVKLGTASKKSVAEIRSLLQKQGAKGISISFVPETAATKREGVTAKSIASLDSSVSVYCAEKKVSDGAAAMCAAIMKEVQK